MQRRDRNHRLPGELRLTRSRGPARPESRTLRIAATGLAVLASGALAAIVGAVVARPGVRLAELPTAPLVRRGTVTAVRLHIRREHGFRGPVVLGVWRMPPGSRASWRLADGRRPRRKRPDRRAIVLPPGASSATLMFRATGSTPLGHHRLRVSAMASGLPRSRRWIRVRVVPLRSTAGDVLGEGVIRGGQSPAGTPADTTGTFEITIVARGELVPGGSIPVDLRLTNPLERPVTLASLRLDVEEATSRPGCSGSANYAVVEPAPEENRILQPGMTLLSGARLTMRNLPVNQDACKGARVTVTAEGAAAG